MAEFILYPQHDRDGVCAGWLSGSMKGMDTISALRREEIEHLSGGRVASVVEIDGEPIRLISSARRKKTISASVRDGMIQLSVPLRMRDADIVASARGMISKIRMRQREAERLHSDPELHQRALYLARVWLGGEVTPTSVVWSDRQTKLWGSCTSTTGTIRISTMLQGMPEWVIDSVVVHELAHLKHGGHGQNFQDFAKRYPRMDEANAFLAGVSFAQRRGEGKTFPDAID